MTGVVVVQLHLVGVSLACTSFQYKVVGVITGQLDHASPPGEGEAEVGAVKEPTALTLTNPLNAGSKTRQGVTL